ATRPCAGSWSPPSARSSWHRPRVRGTSRARPSSPPPEPPGYPRGRELRYEVGMTDPWPSLPLEEWKDTYATLHRWTQIVGKIRLALSSWINHSWHVTLYVTARGLTTSPIWHGTRAFQIDFDFIDHQLLIQDGEGAVRRIALGPRPVADLYRE